MYTSQDIHAAARALMSSRYTTALLGAGLSVESGIPTFRGPGGMWTKLGEPSPLSYQGFKHDPAEWWREQRRASEQTEGPRAQFRMAIDEALPNEGHYAMAELERLGILKHTITQNVDNLHYIAGSHAVAEIHGNRTKVRCIDCNMRWPREEFQVSEDELPPLCLVCGGIIKGDGVMFGEPIPTDVLEVCYEQAGRSDCMVLVGTSGTVYPAASFPELVKDMGGSLIEVNPCETPLSSQCDIVLRGPSGQILPQVVGQIKAFMKNRKE